LTARNELLSIRVLHEIIVVRHRCGCVCAVSGREEVKHALSITRPKHKMIPAIAQTLQQDADMKLN
jgi:hypothetical protein